MKRSLIQFILISVSVSAICIFLNNSVKISGNSIPPIAKFFSPFTGFWQNAKGVNDFPDKIKKFNHLTAPASIVYDDRLVPHIFTENTADAYYLQGYLHAKYRLFQMDISTRSAAGRLSEILGSDLLETDQSQRHMGMTFAAENAIKGWKNYSKQYELVQAYSNGMNDYIASLKPSDYPLEFKLLNYEPEAWSPYKTALFFKNMALTLCSGQNDLEASNMLNHFGVELFNQLYPEDNPKQSPVIPDILPASEPEDYSAVSSQQVPSTSTYQPPPIHRFPKGIGSNNWALSGEKTENGYPILCNDPHLSLTPSFHLV